MQPALIQLTPGTWGTEITRPVK